MAGTSIVFADRPLNSLRFPVGMLLGVLAVGTAGFVALEGLTPTDALYLTVTTVSTVGYGDVVPVTGAGKLFTAVLILCGTGTVLYLLTAVAALVFEGRLQDFYGRTAMNREIDALENHVIVCGFGRFGSAVVEELIARRTPLVIVDVDREIEPALQGLEVPYMIGSGLSDDVLRRAGIARAWALVVCTPSDSDNVFITLSARDLNPQIRLHARAESEAGSRRLRLAGAHQVVSAYQIGGSRIAASILRPAVVDFLEVSTLGRGDDEVALEEIRVSPGCALLGRTIGELERERPRLRIVALRRGDAALRITPDPTTEVRSDDLLVLFGERTSLDQLAESAQSSKGR